MSFEKYIKNYPKLQILWQMYIYELDVTKLDVWLLVTHLEKFSTIVLYQVLYLHSLCVTSWRSNHITLCKRKKKHKHFWQPFIWK